MDENQVPETTTQEQTVDPIVEKALEMGWRPQEEFDGPPEDFIDAKEFVRRKPLFDRIEHQSKELKSVRKALEALKGHYTKVQETEYQRALASLKEARKEALRDGDGDRFEAIDTEIKQVERQASEIRDIAPIEEPTAPPPEFQAWLHRNPWYTDESSDYMKVYADKVGRNLATSGKPPQEILAEVEKAVRKEFPHKFRNPNKDAAPEVNSSRSAPASSKKGEIELTEQERNIMNTLVRSGTMTKEQYIADLKKVKGLS